MLSLFNVLFVHLDYDADVGRFPGESFEILQCREVSIFESSYHPWVWLDGHLAKNGFCIFMQ